jgi:hypothetical protein
MLVMSKLRILGVSEKRRLERNSGMGREPIGPEMEGDRGIVLRWSGVRTVGAMQRSLDVVEEGFASAANLLGVTFIFLFPFCRRESTFGRDRQLSRHLFVRCLREVGLSNE